MHLLDNWLHLPLILLYFVITKQLIAYCSVFYYMCSFFPSPFTFSFLECQWRMQLYDIMDLRRGRYSKWHIVVRSRSLMSRIVVYRNDDGRDIWFLCSLFSFRPHLFSLAISSNIVLFDAVGCCRRESFWKLKGCCCHFLTCGLQVFVKLLYYYLVFTMIVVGVWYIITWLTVCFNKLDQLFTEL